jgi:stress-induced morphogen
MTRLGLGLPRDFLLEKNQHFGRLQITSGQFNTKEKLTKRQTVNKYVKARNRRTLRNLSMKEHANHRAGHKAYALCARLSSSSGSCLI